MFMLPRAGICRYAEWKQLSSWEQYLMLTMWEQEQDYLGDTSSAKPN